MIGIDAEIPRAQLLEPEFFLALFLQFACERHDVMLDCVVEAQAILRRVIEALVAGESVGAEIGVAGGVGDFVAQDKELVENFLHFIGVLQAALGHGLPRGLAARAIGLLLDAAHARECLLLPVELHGHAAADFLVLLR